MTEIPGCGTSPYAASGGQATSCSACQIPGSAATAAAGTPADRSSPGMHPAAAGEPAKPKGAHLEQRSRRLDAAPESGRPKPAARRPAAAADHGCGPARGDNESRPRARIARGSRRPSTAQPEAWRRAGRPSARADRPYGVELPADGGRPCAPARPAADARSSAVQAARSSRDEAQRVRVGHAAPANRPAPDRRPVRAAGVHEPVLPATLGVEAGSCRRRPRANVRREIARVDQPRLAGSSQGGEQARLRHASNGRSRRRPAPRAPPPCRQGRSAPLPRGGAHRHRLGLVLALMAQQQVQDAGSHRQASSSSR